VFHEFSVLPHRKPIFGGERDFCSAIVSYESQRLERECWRAPSFFSWMGGSKPLGCANVFAAAHRACCAEYPYFVFSVLCARDMGEAREALRSCK
jgi:hypothetical protein